LQAILPIVRFLRTISPPAWRLVNGVLAFAVIGSVALAQAPKESDVEAAYLFNFARFMHDPPHTTNVFTIGVWGKNPFGVTLDQLTAHEQVDGRTLRIVPVTTADDARLCDILFISDSETTKLDKDVASLQGSGTLTVSNAPGFLDHGGMIQFVVLSHRVRFAVNLNAVNRGKITLSSELLKVALSVTGSTSPTEVQP